jgi:hypothetical protein
MPFLDENELRFTHRLRSDYLYRLMAKVKKSKSSITRERRERRFVPQSGRSPLLVKALGAVGAAALGAGTWAQFGTELSHADLQPHAFAPYMLAGGALLVAVAIWLGTSGEAALRVGAGGIAVEKAEVKRIPWHAVERIVWNPERAELTVRGKDANDKEISIAVAARTHPYAAAWIMREARDRIPRVTDVPDEVIGLPGTSPADGQVIVLEPVQVVGSHCAESGRVIAYEPDARVCPKCELVYHKNTVPEACSCGASLAGMRAVDASRDAS